jgi:hypothetical protein
MSAKYDILLSKPMHLNLNLYGRNHYCAFILDKSS